MRLARLLVELATRYGRPGEDGTVLGCRLTQPELAALTGAAETTVQKALRELRAEGLLTTGYAATVIRDLPRLRELGDLAPEGYRRGAPGNRSGNPGLLPDPGA